VGDFDADTALTGGDGRYRATLSPDWEIWGPNGGYVATIALRAVGATSRFTRPASLHAHFLSVAAFDEVDITVTQLRATRVAESHRVAVTQGDRAILEAIVWTVDQLRGLEHDEMPIPDDVAPPAELSSVDERLLAAPRPNRPVFTFWENLEDRPLDWIDDWENRTPSEARYRGWMRFRPRATFDDPFVDAGRSLIVLDTMGWPAAVRAYAPPIEFIAPNIDLAVHFHRLEPKSEFLFVEHTAPIADDGLVGTRARVWGESGRLLASGSQTLLCRPVPPAS